MDAAILKAYTDVETSDAALSRNYKHVSKVASNLFGKRVSVARVKRVLNSRTKYQLFKRPKHKFLRVPFYAPEAFYCLQLDSAFLDKIAPWNNGYKGFVLAVDTFSRYCMGFCFQTLKAPEIVSGLRKILEKTGATSIATDLGREYDNNTVGKMLDELNVRHLKLRDTSIKSAICERGIQTVKHMIRHYQFEHDTLEYVNAF